MQAPRATPGFCIAVLACIWCHAAAQSVGVLALHDFRDSVELARTYTDNWFPTFFGGQNQPPDVKTKVYLSAYLWRVTDVNELDYTFTAHLRYTLTWADEGAAETIDNATQRQRDAGEPCRRPCTNVHYPAGDPGMAQHSTLVGECAPTKICYRCSSARPGRFCSMVRCVAFNSFSLFHGVVCPSAATTFGYQRCWYVGGCYLCWQLFHNSFTHMIVVHFSSLTTVIQHASASLPMCYALEMAQHVIVPPQHLIVPPQHLIVPPQQVDNVIEMPQANYYSR